MQLAKQIAKQVLSTVKSSVAEPLTLQAYKVSSLSLTARP